MDAWYDRGMIVLLLSRADLPRAVTFEAGDDDSDAMESVLLLDRTGGALPPGRSIRSVDKLVGGVSEVETCGLAQTDLLRNASSDMLLSFMSSSLRDAASPASEPDTIRSARFHPDSLAGSSAVSNAEDRSSSSSSADSSTGWLWRRARAAPAFPGSVNVERLSAVLVHSRI